MVPNYTNYQKEPKNAFLPTFFFKNLPAAQQVWSKRGICNDLGELKKWSIKKTSRQVFRIFFQNLPHPSRKSQIRPCIRLQIFSVKFASRKSWLDFF